MISAENGSVHWDVVEECEGDLFLSQHEYSVSVLSSVSAE